MSKLPDGRTAYELRHPWRDGTTHVVFTGVELLEKLAVLTPSPRANISRDHGALAPGAKSRGTIVRDRAQAESRPRTEPPPLGKADGAHSSQKVIVPVLVYLGLAVRAPPITPGRQIRFDL